MAQGKVVSRQGTLKNPAIIAGVNSTQGCLQFLLDPARPHLKYSQTILCELRPDNVEFTRDKHLLTNLSPANAVEIEELQQCEPTMGTIRSETKHT